jgi:hypothetical protein
MKTITREEFINRVAEQFAKSFLTALQNLCDQKNYYSHIGSLAEILDWANDFCELYYEKIEDGQFYAGGPNELRIDVVPEPLIISFGRERLLRFYKTRHASSQRFIEKYSSL